MYAICTRCIEYKMIARDGMCHWCLHVLDREQNPELALESKILRFNWQRNHPVKHESTLPPAPIQRRKKKRVTRASGRLTQR